MHLQFTAVKIYSRFLSATCPQNAVRKMLSLNSDWLIPFLEKRRSPRKKGLSQSTSEASSTRKLHIEKRDCGGERRPPRSGGWRVSRRRGRVFRFREVK